MSLINTIRNNAPGVKNSELILKAFGQEDNIEKAKYIRREGSKGNYKYYYKEKDGKGRVWTKEQETAISKNDKAFSDHLKKKGIDEHSKEASDEWVNSGFQEKQNKILEKTKKDNLKWNKNLMGGEYVNYKMGTILRGKDDNDKIVYIVKMGAGLKGNENLNASSLEDAKAKIDKYTEERNNKK